ncbi:MAG: 1,4-beta-xylanase [Bacteroidetes bacterium]|nr:MAG: 1,4-beta-xylanase [Bacteroidota bacterium]
MKGVLIFLAASQCMLFPCFAQDTTKVIPLWENGAPGYENRKNEPEQAKDYWVKNIQNPSITVYLPPKEKATGAAVVICPGGGHRLLVYNAEGRDPALYLNSIGVAAVILKYRLAREENSPYQLEKEVKQDGLRAMRLVRSHAKEWNIDTNRIGIMGFSAGGEVVALVTYDSSQINLQAKDPVDRLSAKPNFQILIYPGPLFIPDVIPRNAPPAFLLVANDDSCCSPPIMKLLQKYREAKIPVEAHIYSQGNHAFNMGYRSNLQSIHSWPQRLADWLGDNHFLVPEAHIDSR